MLPADIGRACQAFLYGAHEMCLYELATNFSRESVLVAERGGAENTLNSIVEYGIMGKPWLIENY
jgi:hypothetical protein